MSIQDPRREGEDVDLVRHLEDDQVDDPLNHQLYLTLMSKLTRTFIFTFVYNFLFNDSSYLYLLRIVVAPKVQVHTHACIFNR